jgi:UDP-GlcNAc3NAcA epimerase
MKIVTIVGARPQFVKAAVLSRAIASMPGITEVIIHTGQHYDINMSDIFFEEMSIPKPDYHLGINGKSHGAMTGQMLEAIEAKLLINKPDWLLVYGDTNSTLAGALAAKKLHIKIAHVEAGLRSFNIQMPEEVNRILTDRMSDMLFCPTEYAVQNLHKEGFSNFDCKVINTGDVMQDAAMYYAADSAKPDMDLPSTFCLATVHRAENTDDPKKLSSLFKALDKISETIPVILPLHPRTKSCLSKFGISPKKVRFIDPIGYFEMIWLLQNCKAVLTDSGGLQKEAFFFHKPCLTLRDETEWLELVDHKFNQIVGANEAKILDAYEKLDFTLDYNIDLYGEGKAANKILNELQNFTC